MSPSKVNLLKAFQAVSQALNQNQSALNQADTYNHDHGDNMVEIFRVITQAMDEKKGASPAGQLTYASELLRYCCQYFAQHNLTNVGKMNS